MTSPEIADLRALTWPKAEPVAVDGRRLAVYRLVSRGMAAAAPAGASFQRSVVPPADPPVLLLHGLSGPACQWHSLVSRLPCGRRILAPDLPGFGESEARGGYALSALATTVAALLDAEASGPVDVIGHDWGATLAIALSAARPELVRRLGMISGMWPPWLAAGPGHPAPGLRRRERRLETPTLAARSARSGYLQPDPALGGVPKPERSLVIWGTRPRFLPPRQAEKGRLSPRYGEKVVSALGRCVDPATVEMITLPGVGHGPHLTAPGVVGPLLCEFLRAS